MNVLVQNFKVYKGMHVTFHHLVHIFFIQHIEKTFKQETFTIINIAVHFSDYTKGKSAIA